jgi:hypothetical protein
LKVWRQQDAAKATVRTFVLTFPELNVLCLKRVSAH